MTTLRDEISRMSVEERLDLIEQLWESLEDRFEELPLTDEQKRELDRRLALHEAHPDRAIPWEQVRAELEAEE